MTRFARAKGSKASNEREPDEPTPWHLMKQQLEDSVESRKLFGEKKPKNAAVLLREHDEACYVDPGTINHDWADFESEKKTVSKNKKSNKASLVNENVDSKRKSSNVEIQESFNNKTSKLHNDDVDNSSSIKEDQTRNEEKGQKHPNESKKSIKKKRKQETSHDSIPQNPSSSPKKLDTEESNGNIDKPTVKLSKRQKRNRKNKIRSSDGDNNPESKEIITKNSGAFNAEGNEWSTDVNFGCKKQSITSNGESNQAKDISQPDDNLKNPNSLNNLNRVPERFNKGKVVKKRKPPKIRDDKEHKRKKPHPGSTRLIINGIEVEIVMYDGFPIKKEDADRLTELRQQMVMKGIPKSEINAAMKLERRKAEKNLARVRKNVCFHCRKAGHNLSDCPDLGKEEETMGICFKCGSTEHTHFQCQVRKKEEFGFAKCFICREQGHIAKQCPDNPKGLYPNGGACKICGDVTHLKKDCPDLLNEKEKTEVTLNTINSDVIDSLESGENKREEVEKVKNKVVKF